MAEGEIVERNSIYIAEYYGLTEDGAKAFFSSPNDVIGKIFGISEVDSHSIDAINSIFLAKREAWTQPEEQGMVLLCVAYMIASTISRKASEINWEPIYRDGFLEDIRVFSSERYTSVFLAIANWDKPYFMFRKNGFDILDWERLLSNRESWFPRHRVS